MKKGFIYFFLFLSIVKVYPQENKIEVKINKNTEYVSFLTWLIFFGDLYEKKVSILNWTKQEFQIDTYEKFKKFKNDPLLKSLKKADKNEGLSSYIYLFSILNDFPNAKLTKKIKPEFFISFSDSLSLKDKKDFTKKVVSDLNQFYKKINFNEFIDNNQKLYEKVVLEVQNNLPNENFLPEMKNFYQQNNFESFTLNPSLLIPSGMGFGPNLNGNIHNFFGSFNGMDFDKNTTGFENSDKILKLATHEFGHSFVNHIVVEFKQEIEKSEYLFKPIMETMKSQGYRNWEVALYEHFVRAGEIVISSNLGNQETSDSLYQKYVVDRNFIYIPIILKHLNYYNQNKDKITYRKTVKNAIKDLKNYR